MARPAPRNVNVGITISKSQLDVCIHKTQQFVSFGNDAKGIRQLVLLLDLFPVERFVLEATDRLEKPFVEAALEHGLTTYRPTNSIALNVL